MLHNRGCLEWNWITVRARNRVPREIRKFRANAILPEKPRIESFQVDGVPARYADKVKPITGWLSGSVPKGFAVYRLKTGDLRFGNVSHSPSEFKVKPGELVISLVPKTAQ